MDRSRELPYAATVRILLVLIAAGLLSVSPALADVPAGMILEPVISARAAYVAGKPVSIYCAPTDAVWQNTITATGDVPPGGITNGITPVVGGNVAYLAPDTCRPILKRLARETPSLLALGATLDVLTVESLHMGGEVGDGQTACDALKVLPGFLVAKWGFRKNTAVYLRVMQGAFNYHRAQGAPYAGNC